VVWCAVDHSLRASEEVKIGQDHKDIVDLYIHSALRLQGIVLISLSTGISLLFKRSELKTKGT
jgi:hypothetical protein